MHFQVRTDNHIENSEGLADGIRSEVEAALLPQFAGRLRRVEVYLQDMNSHKGGIDTRCAIEVSIAGHQPVTVTNNAGNVEEAVTGAVEKLARSLEKALGRLDDQNDRVSMSGDPT